MKKCKGFMTDTTHCKVHPHAAGARGDNRGMGRIKGDSTSCHGWCHSGLQPACHLDGIAMKCICISNIIKILLGQNSNLSCLQEKTDLSREMYDNCLYQVYCHAGNAFRNLKRQPEIATSYAKTRELFVVAMQIRCMDVRINALGITLVKIIFKDREKKSSLRHCGGDTGEEEGDRSEGACRSASAHHRKMRPTFLQAGCRKFPSPVQN